ncbi:MAG: hypothetical protein FWD18_08835 [Micrococcales bacterium]|nr:hypothetical protein [Micrococcales bacterium]
MSLETKIDASPDSLREVSKYLSSILLRATDMFREEITKSRRDAEESWDCKASDILDERLHMTERRLDELIEEIDMARKAIDALAEALDTALDLMAQARSVASDGGLWVTGTLISGWQLTSLSGAVAKNDPVQQAIHQAKAEAWENAVALTKRAHGIWNDAIETFTSKALQSTSNLSAITRRSRENIAKSVSDGSAMMVLSKSSIVSLTLNITEAVVAGTEAAHRQTVLSSRANIFHEMAQSQVVAEAAPGASPESRGPIRAGTVLSRGFMILGVGATIYGIHDDISSGKSTERAVVSNTAALGAGLLATVGTGALVGGTAGSVVPVVGTIAGVAVGMVAAAVVYTVVDSHYEPGLLLAPGHDDGYPSLHTIQTGSLLP